VNQGATEKIFKYIRNRFEDLSDSEKVTWNEFTVLKTLR
jgi:hypothetical protein